MVEQWSDELAMRSDHVVLACAAQWGADQELEACCGWFQEFYKTECWVKHDLKQLCASRRPQPPTFPADSLVGRVAIAIAAADDEGLTNMTWNYHARAAILEVATWMVEQAPEPGPVAEIFAVMADMLRDEDNR